MRFLAPSILAVLLAAVSFLRPPHVETSMESLAGDAIESVPEEFRKSASSHVLVFSGLEGRDLGEFIQPPGDIPAPQDSVVANVDRELAPFPVPGVGNTIAAKTALSNSFAFGGSNASVILGVA